MSISAISIGLSGMKAAVAQLDASAVNTANVLTAGAVPGSPGAATHPVYQPVTVELSEASAGGQPAGVTVGLSRTKGAILQTYDPTSPLADSKGMVAVPNIAVPGEVAKVLAARRQFEASANLLQVATRMQKSALDVLA